MVRRIVAAALIVVALVGLLPAIAYPAKELPERQRLIELFKSVQDVLLTINSEIIQYQDRFTDLSRKLQDPRLWNGPSLDEDRLLPHIKGLNRLKMAVALIGTGLETKYSQLKTFQAELRDRYPNLTMEIEYHYNLFDKVYDDSRDRHRRLTRDMDELKGWFKSQVAARTQRHAQEQSYSTRPFRKRHAKRPAIAPELAHPAVR